jgi:hypothetical protein
VTIKAAGNNSRSVRVLWYFLEVIIFTKLAGLPPSARLRLQFEAIV